MKAGESKWSEKFSLDTVGSSGAVVCKSEGRDYEVRCVGAVDSLSANGSAITSRFLSAHCRLA